jgi:hypothetical protein
MKPHKGKGRTGPGGIGCPCCTKGTRQYVKRLTARWARRMAKKETQKALHDS